MPNMKVRPMNYQGYAKKKQTICIRHFAPPNGRQLARLQHGMKLTMSRHWQRYWSTPPRPARVRQERSVAWLPPRQANQKK
jgi:hypothetical protein